MDMMSQLQLTMIVIFVEHKLFFCLIRDLHVSFTFCKVLITIVVLHLQGIKLFHVVLMEL